MKKMTLGYIAIMAALILTSVLSVRLFFRERTDHDIIDIHIFPYRFGEWTGEDIEIKEFEYKILETRNLIFRKYTNSAKQNIFLFIVYSETNRSVFHPPEVCLIGSGITIKDKKSEKINTGKFEFLSNKLYLEKNNNKDIALYAYKVGNLYTDNYYLQQVCFAFNQLFGKQRGGSTIRVSMPVTTSEEKTLTALKKFMKDVVQALDKLS